MSRTARIGTSGPRKRFAISDAAFRGGALHGKGVVATRDSRAGRWQAALETFLVGGWNVTLITLERDPDKSRPPQPLVLKIETRLAVENLPQLIVQCAGRRPMAVMIARGDLAVELGFGRLSEIQEEILWLCDAAHVPVIWATQVLDNFVTDGVPTRAEATDAAMSQRAECVMLNKGPFLVDAVTFLKDVLRRMEQPADLTPIC